jgi:hypothetical protein
MRLIQYRSGSSRHVGLVEADGDHARPLAKVATVYELAMVAIAMERPLHDLARELATDTVINYAALLKAGDVLAPLDHPEPARLHVTGTGLTHTGSAAARDKMHALAKASGAPESDSMKMFRMGVEGGKPAPGAIGVAPEWFYKGNGTSVVPPGGALPVPGFGLTGGEEPEVVGLYIIDDAGQPRRIGFALGNEFSDHTIEAQNYLYLAHSKLRACSMGPELLLGALPHDIRGTSRVLRAGKPVFEDHALLGEANMSHTIANLEHHHFKYGLFRRPGDLHAHYFGAAVLSFSAGVKTMPGDEFVIEAMEFGKPLRNTLIAEKDEGLVAVKML